jgi:hypothetical protein
MIQVVLITRERMYIHMPFDSCHHIKAHSMITFILSLIMYGKKNKIREKKKVKTTQQSSSPYTITDLSMDAGMVHNHFDNDERG